MAPNANVIVHHEGAGGPTDNIGRMGAKKYSIIVGLTKYELRYPPARSFVTSEAGIGHTLQLGLTGNRNQYRITDKDLQLIRDAIRDARKQGWVTDSPRVTFHGDHEKTACPGAYTAQRRPEIVAACQKVELPPPPPPVKPPPAPTTYIWEDEHMRSALVPIGPLDANGRGWTDWDPGFGRDPVPGSMQATLHGSSPPEDGYWYVDSLPILGVQARGGKVRISVMHGQPTATVNVHVQAA